MLPVYTSDGSCELHLAVEKETEDTERLEQYLQSHLPSYMCPRHIHFIPCFPQNNSNKTDRNQLLKYHHSITQKQSSIWKRTELLETLNGIFRKVLKRDDITLTESTTAHDVDGWDSLTNMVLLTEIEKKFGVRFTFREIVKLKNVGDLCHTILNKAK